MRPLCRQPHVFILGFTGILLAQAVWATNLCQEITSSTCKTIPPSVNDSKHIESLAQSAQCPGVPASKICACKKDLPKSETDSLGDDVRQKISQYSKDFFATYLHLEGDPEKKRAAHLTIEDALQTKLSNTLNNKKCGALKNIKAAYRETMIQKVIRSGENLENDSFLRQYIKPESYMWAGSVLTHCSTTQEIKTDAKVVEKLKTPTILCELEPYTFNSNSSNISENDAASFMSKFHNDPCIKEALRLETNSPGSTSIVISTSANRVRNTGDAAGKTFEALSCERASTIESLVKKSSLFNEAKQHNSNFKIVTAYKGTNGDGTSGPCPYQMDVASKNPLDQTKQIMSDQQLEKFRYAKIQVKVNPKILEGKKSDFNVASITCKQLSFECKNEN